MKSKENINPPRWTQRFLEWYCRPELLEDLQGDLNEYFNRNLKERGYRRAQLIYIVDVLKFLRSYTFRKRILGTRVNAILFNNYYKTAYRNLLKNRLTTFLNIVGLTLGISCFMLISIYVQHEYNFDNYYNNKNRIYRLTLELTSKKANETIQLAYTNPQLPEELRELYPEIEDATGIIRVEKNVSVKIGSSSFEEDNFCRADSHYFGVFSHTWIAGNPAKALLEPRSIVLTKKLSEKYFGDENPINKTLTIQGEEYKVTGMIQDPPDNIDLKFDALLSQQSEDWYFTYVLFKNTADVLSFQQKLNNHFNEYFKPVLEQSDTDGAYHMEALTDIHFGERKMFDAPKGSKVALYTFSIIALLILVVSCINYINMGVAQSVKRQAEIGIRKVFGASKSQIQIQFIMESLLMSLASWTLSIGLVIFLLQSFRRNNILNISPNTIGVLPLFLFIAVVIVIIGILGGSYLVLNQTKTSPVSDLKGLSAISDRKIFRSALVILQFTVAIALIFCTRIVYNQMQLLMTNNAGFDKEQVMVLDIPSDDALYPTIPALKNSLKTLSSVKTVSITGYHSTPTSELVWDTYTVEHHGQDMIKLLSQLYVDEDYFDALGIQFIAGRKFSPSDFEGSVVIVNEAMVKNLGWKKPLEQTIDYGISGTLSGEGARVIGIVKDFNFNGLQKKAEPLQFYPTGKHEPEQILIKLENADMNAIWAIEKVWQQHFKGHPFEYQFLDDYFKQQLEKENTVQKLMTYFSIIAIAIACLGLFGMINIGMAQKMKETGIRKILGAKALHLLALSWKNHFIQVSIASVLAFPIVFFTMSQWLEGFSNKTTIELTDYLLAILVLALAIVLTMSWQVIKIVNLNPLESIKRE